MFAQWEQNYIYKFDLSIEYLELLGVCMAVFAWSKELRDRRYVVFCDNQSVMTMINNTSAKCVNCMVLIRLLTLRSLIFNMRVFAKWVPGAANVRSDLLSHQKISKFKEIMKYQQTDALPTTLPAELWPASKLWITSQN